MREERRADLERAAATVPDGTVAEALLLDGPAGRALAAASEDLDLLVCGSRGYGAVGSVLLGSVSHHLVRTAACPLLVVPRDGAGRARAPRRLGGRGARGLIRPQRTPRPGAAKRGASSSRPRP